MILEERRGGREGLEVTQGKSRLNNTYTRTHQEGWGYTDVGMPASEFTSSSLRKVISGNTWRRIVVVAVVVGAPSIELSSPSRIRHYSQLICPSCLPRLRLRQHTQPQQQLNRRLFRANRASKQAPVGLIQHWVTFGPCPLSLTWLVFFVRLKGPTNHSWRAYLPSTCSHARGVLHGSRISFARKNQQGPGSTLEP